VFRVERGRLASTDMSRPSSPILISDDEKEPAAAPVAAVQGAKDEQAPVAVAEGSNDGDGIETPSWLPDGFEIEGYYERDGTFKATVRPSPFLTRRSWSCS
jgi:hypothetical protein